MFEHAADILFNKQIFVSALLGALIGVEREIRGKDPSLRTFAYISMGSCLFSMISIQSVAGVAGADPSRIAAQIVTGIGFLGVGTIFRSSKGISGLTTAAMMWVTAGIGMMVGFDKIPLATTATLYLIAISVVLNMIHDIIRRFKPEGFDDPKGPPTEAHPGTQSIHAGISIERNKIE